MVDIKGFDLNLLRVLDALLSETQVSAAARRLSRSQPATSAALTRLRQAGHVLDKTKRETGTVYRIATPGRAVRSRKAA